jgi:hypothetical protein
MYARMCVQEKLCREQSDQGREQFRSGEAVSVKQSVNASNGELGREQIDARP